MVKSKKNKNSCDSMIYVSYSYASLLLLALVAEDDVGYTTVTKNAGGQVIAAVGMTMG